MKINPCSVLLKAFSMKFMVALLIAFLFCTFHAAAGVPRKMAYQIMALNPTTGQVLANRDVNIRIELRQDKTDGQAVWHQDFEARTDEAGICQLTLELADDIDWASADYYLATLIDGKECGASQVMSVPYALQAATVEGNITRKELVGSWMDIFWDGTYNNGYGYVFNEDGSGYRLDYYYDPPVREDFKWTLDNMGRVLLHYNNQNGSWAETLSIQILSATSIAFKDCIYQKQ